MAARRPRFRSALWFPRRNHTDYNFVLAVVLLILLQHSSAVYLHLRLYFDVAAYIPEFHGILRVALGSQHLEIGRIDRY